MPGYVTSPGSVGGGDVPTGQRMDRFELRYLLLQFVGVTLFRMERMENSIHELIAALHPSGRSQPQLTTSSFVPPAPVLPEDESDEDDDNVTRPTAVGTDESEERTVPHIQ